MLPRTDESPQCRERTAFAENGDVAQPAIIRTRKLATGAYWTFFGRVVASMTRKTI
jgi:hypothetical protein